MGRPLYTNNAATYLAFGITNTATTMQVSANAGNLFPNPTGGDYFYVSLISLSGPIIEIVKCTARSGDIFTIERGQEGTTPLYWNMGDNVQLRITAAGMNYIAGAAVQSTEEQVFTATQGQTVFTLTNFDYAPGTNNLAVFVNGSKQVYGTNYSETSVNTVTFNSGLNAGDIVEFLVGISVASGTLYANEINYNEGGVGAVTTTVQSKLQESISVKDFGAVGDGVADDTAAINAALTALKPGQALYFPTTTSYYLVTSTITISSAYVTLLGDSKNSGIKYTGTGPALIVANSFFAMRNILLVGNGGAYGAGATSTYGVDLHGSSNIGNMLFENVTIQSFGSDGISMQNGIYTICVDKCTIQGNGGCGIASQIVSSDQDGNALTVTASGIYGNASDGIRWKASALNVTGANVFEVNKGYGINLTWGSSLLSPLPSGFSIKGNYFENNLLGQINLKGNGGVYVNGAEIESNYMLMSNAAGGTGSATGPMGVAITATAFINCAESGFYGVRNVRFGKNTFNATGNTLAYTFVDGGSSTAFDSSVIVEQSIADDTRYVNLGDAQYKKIFKTLPINGAFNQKGFAWTTYDKSDNIYVNGAVTGYFEVPLKAGEAIWQIDLLTQQASSQSYTVLFDLQSTDGTTTTAYSSVGAPQTFTNASGGTVVNTENVGAVLYRAVKNSKVRLKVTVTMGAVATTMYLYDPIITIV